jgi:hypothetical protein
MPLIPIPPIPTKWMGPISRGSLIDVPPNVGIREAQISGLPLLDASLSRGMTSTFLAKIA